MFIVLSLRYLREFTSDDLQGLRLVLTEQSSGLQTCQVGGRQSLK